MQLGSTRENVILKMSHVTNVAFLLNPRLLLENVILLTLLTDLHLMNLLN